jgi:glycosyl-4,4'-diaponeurosporenoate acyltransferase
VLSAPVTVAVDVAAWAVIHASTGYLVHRLPLRLFARDRMPWRERGWERGGDLYVHRFRIKRWKRFLPEAGGWFAGGFDKKQLRAVNDGYLERYAAETRRAETGHVLAAAMAPLFFLWNPYPVGVVMLVYGVVANLPCVLAQRYNRLRILRVLARRRRLRPSPDSG